MKRRDLSGQRFGRLIAVQRLQTRIKPSGQKYSVWQCKCDCGNERAVPLGDLITGNTMSCGCLKNDMISTLTLKHGKTRTPTYRCWTEMRKRCLDTNNGAYQNYGGRGITICERWRNSFEAFLADMGERPSGMQIERKDNNGPYSPENCVWATAAQQARNRRSNILVTIDGESLCLLDWCNKLGLGYMRVRARIKKLGWTPLQALGLESRSSTARSNGPAARTQT